MFFVLGGALLWWGALGDLMVWGVLAGGGSHVLDGCSSGLGQAVPSKGFYDAASGDLLINGTLKVATPRLDPCNARRRGRCDNRELVLSLRAPRRAQFKGCFQERGPRACLFFALSRITIMRASVARRIWER